MLNENDVLLFGKKDLKAVNIRAQSF